MIGVGRQSHHLDARHVVQYVNYCPNLFFRMLSALRSCTAHTGPTLQWYNTVASFTLVGTHAVAI